MIEMSYSDVIKDVAILIWPGTKRRSELGGIWESKLRNLAIFFAGLLEEAPRKEPSS